MDIAIELQKNNSTKTYQANRNFIISQLVKRIIILLNSPQRGKKILDKILKKAKKIRSQKRDHRSRERKVKHPRKKHLIQRKSCL